MRRHPRSLLHQATFLVPIVALLLTLTLVPMSGSTPVAEAKVNSSGGFASGVACLNSSDQFVTTQFANTMYSPASGTSSVAGIAKLDDYNVNSSLTTLGTIGASFGLAYDDGGASGHERLFAAAYTKRFTNYGTGGAGAVYVFEKVSGVWTSQGYFQAANLGGARANGLDTDAMAKVGRTSLGGMQVSPDGTLLYIMNVQWKRIEVFNLLSGGMPTYVKSIPVNLDKISTDAATKNDLWPFALKFFPYRDGAGNPLLIIGVTDSASRGIGSDLLPLLSNVRDSTFSVPPRVHVLTYATTSGSWYYSLNQDLGNDPVFANRSVYESQWIFADWDYPVKGWNQWRESFLPWHSQMQLYPQPMLTDIEFVNEQMPSGSPSWGWPVMVLGIRDRTADILYNGVNAPAGEGYTTAHGDTLAYRYNGSAWTLQTVNRQNNTQLTGSAVMKQANAYDFFNDDLHSFPPPTPAHLENHAGGLATIPSTGTDIDSFGVKLATTTLLGGGGAQGVYVYDNKGASGGDPTSNVTVIANNSPINHTKTANLGDLEVLCSYALAGGRVWNDADADGIQDSTESGIANIALDLRRNSDNAVLASLTTNSTGKYLFAVPPNIDAKIVVNTASSGAAISGYHITKQSVPTSNALNDSNAFMLGGAIQFRGPTKTLLTGELRAPIRSSDERTFDIGLTKQLPSGFVGDRVWIDANSNGLQDSGEGNATNMNGMVVTLNAISTEPGVVDRTTTISNGTYGFNYVVPGTYNVIFPAAPAGYQISPGNQGPNDLIDSDASLTTHTSPNFTVNENWQDKWDYGIYGGADLWVTKSASLTTMPVNTQFTYTLNYGNRTGVAPSVVVNDTLPTGMVYVSASPAPTTRSGQALSWSLGQLNAGATGSIQITVRAPTALSPASLTQQSLQNCASVSSTTADTNAADNSSCVSVIVQRPEINITKTAPASVVIGTQFTYSLTVANDGASPAAGLVVTDPLPLGMTFVGFTAGTSGCSYTAASRTVSCDLGTFMDGASASRSFTVQADYTFAGTSFGNTATVTTTSLGDDPSDNSSSTTTTILRPDVRVVKTSQATALVGDTFPYTVVYSNIGTAPAANVQVNDTLPAGLTFDGFVTNPAPACTYTAATRLVNCPVGTLANGASVTVVFNVKADVTMTGTSVSNTATISGPGGTPIPGDNNPGNDTSTTSTTIQFPNPGIGIVINPKPFPVGDPGTITLTYRNTGTGLARSTTIVTTIPLAITLGTLPSGCSITSTTATTRLVTCSVGTLNAGATGTIVLPVSIPPSSSFPLDQIDVSTVISTTTPERTTDQGDNTASDSALVTRPNVYVTASGPDAVARVVWGSAFNYTIGYGNDAGSLTLPPASRHPSSQTRAAQSVVLQVTLPADATYLTASVAPSSIVGKVLTWNLNTLTPLQTGSLRVAVKTTAPAGASLTMVARISTTTAGDDTIDNQATVTTLVVPPPVDIPDPTSEMRLAIRSTLDPNSNDANQTNGVYVSDGPNITWPAGEVLDFTPRLTSYTLSDPGWPYENRVRLIGWGIDSFEVNGRVINPKGMADARGLMTCRIGAVPAIAPQALTGCAYAYVGASATGRLPSAFLPTTALLESDLNTQAHVYWTQPPTPPMRNDVYLYTVDPLVPVKMTLSVEVEEWIVNSCPNYLLDPLGPCGTEEEMPQPARKRQLVTQTFTVTLLVPRSVVGPGDSTTETPPR